MAVLRNKRYVVCVAGWHFNEGFYRQVMRLGGDVFVISHRPRSQVPDYVAGLVGCERVLFEPNCGYDWGCYEQFRRRGLWRDYDGVMFIHDDAEIRSPALTTRCAELLKTHAVVGNGRNGPRSGHPSVYPQSYAHSRWKPASRTFEHDVVRGSFFATTREALRILGAFEVHWDPWHLSPGLGNWSTRASCGKWEASIGPACFGFLADSYRESEFLVELERGGAGEAGKETVSAWKRRAMAYVHKVSIQYMDHYWYRDSTHYRIRPLVLKKLSAIVWAWSLAPGAWDWGECMAPTPADLRGGS